MYDVSYRRRVSQCDGYWAWNTSRNAPITCQSLYIWRGYVAYFVYAWVRDICALLFCMVYIGMCWCGSVTIYISPSAIGMLSIAQFCVCNGDHRGSTQLCDSAAQVHMGGTTTTTRFRTTYIYYVITCVCKERWAMICITCTISSLSYAHFLYSFTRNAAYTTRAEERVSGV